MMNKILFIDRTHPLLIQKLEESGFVCDLLENAGYEKISEVIHQYTGVIIRSGIVLDKEILSKAALLKFIGRAGSGLESIDLDFAKNKNIACFNSPEGNRDAVGEHTLGILLCLLNKICISGNEIKNGVWLREQNRGVEINEKTVGIIGYGNMGSAFARRLFGFKANVISYDKYKTKYANHFTKEVSLETIFEQADIVSIHIPYTFENRYFVNSDFIHSFKKSIYLVNTSRGAVLNTSDLVVSLKSGKVLGAALDVIEYEESSFDKMKLENMPDDFHFLCQQPNVVLTPHIAGYTHESKIKLAEILADKIIDFSKTEGIISY
jgi:D-3-phosphoglycerate dehydrogenase / 2-oxoglutarate reductase